MLWKRIAVSDHERIVVARNNRFEAILTPGMHRLFTVPGTLLQVEKFKLRDLIFQSRWNSYLMAERPDVVRQHFVVVATNEHQIAMVYADGALFKVLTPAKKALFWRGTVKVTAEIVKVIGATEIPSDGLGPLESLRTNLFVRKSASKEESKTCSLV